jgi:E1A/CREB-binding protein
MAPQQGFIAVDEEDVTVAPQTKQQTISKTEKILQQQLVIILHAHNCQVKEIMDTENTYRCNLPYCQVMKETISHMRCCKDLDNCMFPHCESSQELIAHYKSCVRKSCFVCAPARRVIYKNIQPN